MHLLGVMVGVFVLPVRSSVCSAAGSFCELLVLRQMAAQAVALLMCVARSGVWVDVGTSLRQN
jgi:hypothetical protein